MPKNVNENTDKYDETKGITVADQFEALTRIVADVAKKGIRDKAALDAVIDGVSAQLNALQVWRTGLLDDANVSNITTWSSDKINSALTLVNNQISDLQDLVNGLSSGKDWTDKIAAIEALDVNELQNIADLQRQMANVVNFHEEQVIEHEKQVIITNKLGAARDMLVRKWLGAAIRIDDFYAALMAAPEPELVPVQAYYA